MRKPFIKSIPKIPIEEAHGGSGARRLILSPLDPISDNLKAMTWGCLPVGQAFDWHIHENIDEFYVVLKGSGRIDFENSESIEYKTEDIIYVPANVSHRLKNTDTIDNEFYFMRIQE